MSKGRFTVWAILICLLVITAYAANAQSELRIARPLDGANVRETVNILVPAACVPTGGSVSYFINGWFQAVSVTMSEDGSYYLYRWNTKRPLKDAVGGEVPPQDGRYAIAVQVHDSGGRKIGTQEEITVYVKNNCAADMPAEGIRLRYRNVPGNEDNYRFKYTIDLKNIEGSTEITGALGQAFEGAEGLIKRSVEDNMSGNTFLIRQRLLGTFVRFLGGQGAADPSAGGKSFYNIEDNLGRVVDVLTYTRNTASIDLLNLPPHPVRIGDSWTLDQKVFRDSLTGRAATMRATSTLIDLEWEGGHPCAKIKTEFSGRIRVPFSQFINQQIQVSGEMITYFAYNAGKVISSITYAEAEPQIDEQIVSNITSQLVAKTGVRRHAPTMTDPYQTMGGQHYGHGYDGYGHGYEQEREEAPKRLMRVKLAIRHSLELTP